MRIYVCAVCGDRCYYDDSGIFGHIEGNHYHDAIQQIDTPESDREKVVRQMRQSQ
jgi:hypothetical protein